jgi:hypothetical protein
MPAGVEVRRTEPRLPVRHDLDAHDHNPVNDAIGNVEAFEEILRVAGGS